MTKHPNRNRSEPLAPAAREIDAANRHLQAMQDAAGFTDFEDAWKALLGSLEKCWQ